MSKAGGNISLNDALVVMRDSDTPFDITFVTYNKAKKEGGKVLELKKVMLCGAKHNQKENETISVRRVDNSNHPYPIHIRLITQLNGRKIYY